MSKLPSFDSLVPAQDPSFDHLVTEQDWQKMTSPPDQSNIKFPPMPPQPSLNQNMSDLVKQKLAEKKIYTVLPVGSAVGEPDYYQPDQPKVKVTAWQYVKGAPEAALSVGSSFVTAPFGSFYGFLKQAAHEIRTGKYGSTEAADRIEQVANQYANKLTYEPKTRGGQKETAIANDALSQLTPVLPLHDMPVIAEAARYAKPMLGKKVAPTELPKELPKEKPANPYAEPIRPVSDTATLNKTPNFNDLVKPEEITIEAPKPDLTRMSTSQAVDAHNAGETLYLPIKSAEKLATTKPNEAKVATLKQDIQQNGLQKPVELTESQGKVELADGHHRIEAMKQLGYKEVPVKIDQEYFQNGMHNRLVEQLQKTKETIPKFEDLKPQTPANLSELQSGPFKPIVDAYQRQADRLINKFNEKVGYHYTALKNLPEQDKFRDLKSLTQGRVGAADKIGARISDVFTKASKEDQKNVYKFLTEKTGNSDNISDPLVRQKAVAVKKLIGKVGRALVDRGLLSEESYNKYKDSYLPRVYLEYLLNKSIFGRMGASGRTSDMGNLKFRDPTIPKKVRELILGEIKDPGYLAAKAITQPLRDMAILDFLKKISENPKWTYQDNLIDFNGRKVTPFFLKNEAARLRTQAEYMGEKMPEVLKIAHDMEKKANEAIGKEKVPKDYRQVPDTMRYGELRGLWVRKEIYDDLIGASRMVPEDVSPVESLLGNNGVGTKLNRLWKMKSVILNPPTQVRNFVTNGVQLHLSGVNAIHVPLRIVEALKEIRTNGKYWRIAKKYGIESGTYNASEVMHLEKSMLNLMKNKRTGVMGKLNDMGILIAKAANKMGDIYQFSEALFKTAKIIDTMKTEDMTAAQAVREANKWLYDYSEVPKTVRYLRSAPIGAPFITFYYKTLPRMMEVAIKHPGRLLPYAILPYVLSQWIAQKYNVTHEDVKKLQKTMPGFLQDKATAYIWPYKDEHGRWQAINFEYFLPWSMYTETMKDIGTGQLGQAFQDTGLLGGPIPDLISAIRTNTDPFTKKTIMDDADPPAVQIQSMLNYVWHMAAPPFVTDMGMVGHLKNSLEGKLKKNGDLPLTTTQSLLRGLGINVYPYNAPEQRRRNISYMQFSIKETAKRMSSLLRNKGLTPQERRDIRKEYMTQIKEKQELLKQYSKDSELAPNLRNTPATELQ